MAGLSLSSLHTIMDFIFIVLSTVVILCSNVEAITMKVGHVGEDITLNCTVNNLIHTRWHWVYTESSGNNSNLLHHESSTLSYAELPSNTRYNISFFNQSFVLTIYDITSHDAGDYACVYTNQTRVTDSFSIQVVECSCKADKLVPTTTMNDRVLINCTLTGIHSFSKYSNCSRVNVTLDDKRLINGRIYDGYMTTSLRAKRLCDDHSFEFNFHSDFPYNLQCFLTKLDTCPYTTSTPTIRPSSSPFKLDLKILFICVGVVLILITVIVLMAAYFKCGRKRGSNDPLISNTTDAKATGDSQQHKECISETSLSVRCSPCDHSGRNSSLQRVVICASSQENTPASDHPYYTVTHTSDEKCEQEQYPPDVMVDNSLYESNCGSAPNADPVQIVKDPALGLHHPNRATHQGHDDMTITQHKQTVEPLITNKDQYESVDISGPRSGGDVDDIPLYAMPDKGPRSKRNTIQHEHGEDVGQSSPYPTNLSSNVHDVSALYAQVDKRHKE